MKFLKLYSLLFLALGLSSSPAHASWHKAESDYFVIYADDKEEDIREFAVALERYHSALELLTKREVKVPSPSNRLTIFVVGSGSEVRRVFGKGGKGIAGFYSSRAGNSVAFVQDIKMKKGKPTFSMIVLMHEYAHHFMMSGARFAMPRWMNEGGAEFFSSATFPRDGGISIARPATHRAAELLYAYDVSIEELLDHERYAKKKRGFASFYGQSWLLYHMLFFSEERRGQMKKYSENLIEGMPALEAAENAFGDLGTLEKDMKRYLKKRKLFSFKLPQDMVPAGDVKVSRLPAGEAEMMPIRIRSQRGVNEEKAAELVIEAREIAEEFPGDPGVLTALAEAEYDAGNDDAAIAAADRAIALDRNRTNAYVQKGYALFRKAEEADDQDAAYRAAMAPFSALNKIENDHPLPLIYYYRSFSERGVEPTENAMHAIERAAQLAPFDKSLWYKVALLQAWEGKIELARLSIEPVVKDPHESGLTKRASALYEALAKAPEGQPFFAQDILNAVEESELADNDAIDEDEDDGEATD